MSVKVLIVDDAAFIREALIQICLQAGYQVVGEASNGEEAVLRAQALQPHVIIMDMVLPLKNGIEAATEILQTFPQIKIIACTSMEPRFISEKSKQAGCVGFLAKPFKKQDVLSLLAELNQKSAERKGAYG